MSIPIPSNEEARIQALHQYYILDTSAEEAYDELTRLAAHICGTPTALISLIDRERQWFKSKVGLEITQTHRDLAFCSYAILQPQMLIVQDTYQDARFCNNPLATKELKIRFYAGVPLINPEELALGTLCVIDYVPRDLSAVQQEALKILARQAIAQLELRRNVAALKQVIIQREQTEAALRESEERYRLLVELSPETIAVYSEGKLDYINITGAKLFGAATPEELIGRRIEDFVYPDDQQFPKARVQQIQVKGNLAIKSEQKLVRLDGRVIDVEVTGIPVTYLGKPATQVVIRDITERKQAESALMRARVAEVAKLELEKEIAFRQQVEQQLLHTALHDGLTGLPNRAFFLDRLKYALEMTKRQEDYLFAVLFLDLDRFKVINDSLGHLLGDKLLCVIAERIKACLRSTDTAARLGGDEFTILLDRVKDVSDALLIAKRIQQILSLPFNLDGQEVFTSASIGIAISTNGYDQPEDLLRDVDTAMYCAKSLGKARCELFNSNMYTQAVTRLQLETDMRRALERQEFQVYYQPIVALDIGRLAGFEALVRWQHPQRGLVNPIDFISVAEETGLIVAIGYSVLYEACRQLQAWQRRFGCQSSGKISVNLSVKQFLQPDLMSCIAEILRLTGLSAESLILEITETVIMENSVQLSMVISQLKDLGIGLSINDFGTGYSSLGRLHHFPISMLKIDRSFISSMDMSVDLKITETIITLAHKLGISVTAEGVETIEQFTLLKELKCQYGQGYFFSSALNSEEAAALIMTAPQW
ncbi:MAG: EAL domain-containing protein [Rhizonema sp. PD37]|nr:EAL domain-containing protein [Rhizonema sp. PD37]